MGTAEGNNIAQVVNCYANGNIRGAFVGGVAGFPGWIVGQAATLKNTYYLSSDTVTKSNGIDTNDSDEDPYEATKITEEKIQDTIDSLNKYIENDQDGLGTTEWKRWTLDKDGNPSFVENNEEK